MRTPREQIIGRFVFDDAAEARDDRPWAFAASGIADWKESVAFLAACAVAAASIAVLGLRDL